MNKILIGALALGFVLPAAAQNHDKAYYREGQAGYYQNTILKALDEAESKSKPVEKPKSLRVDVTSMDIPKDPEQYTKAWYNTPVSQGRTGTCWCFSTTSFFESEANRVSGVKVKLSEMYPVYWQYVERARYFVEHRGEMNFGEGSETNAVTAMLKKYGTVPIEFYPGRNPNIPFFDHEQMFNELNEYLKSVKARNAWNAEEVVATTKSILNHYMGEPPLTITIDKKQMSPVQYVEKVLKLKLDDYVNFMSLMQSPWYTNAEYTVGDNWWHSKDYYNIPVADFMAGIKEALKAGYTLSIGGDVSEPGYDGLNQVGVVPSWDIPAEYIDDAARQMRFNNGATTDDHAMHLVGFTEKNGKTWFLLKDSGAGSRNCGEGCKSFGYFFVSEDYVKLKMMTVTVNKDAVQDILKKIKA